MEEDTIFTPHNHQCGNCNTVWFHDPIEVLNLNLAQDFDRATAINEKSHKCPKCGTEEYQVLDAPLDPQFIHDGKRCEPITARIPTVDTRKVHEARVKAKEHLRRMRFFDMLQQMGVGR